MSKPVVSGHDQLAPAAAPLPTDLGHCPECGADVLARCQQCGIRVRGDYYAPGVLSSSAALTPP
ncbi:MAG: DUF2321 domain-containing protein [Pseudonocardia sp.]|nr:DUF2321 domain-containing protein [Pseudonocardia sp.]